MGGAVGAVGGAVDVPAVEDIDPAVIQASERARCLFDCRGTIWATHQNSNGAPTCDGDVYASGAPDIGQCKVRIESQPAEGGGYAIVPQGDVFDPYSVNREFLFNLGGGRLWRVSLRHKGSTLKRSYLYIDTTTDGDRRAIPGEETTPARGETKAAPPSPHGAAETLALGADPIAALLGSAVARMGDPNVQLAFALLMRDGQRERDFADKSIAQAERLFGMMTGVMREAARSQGGGGEVATLLRAQSDAATRAADDAARAAREAREQLHAKELAEARAANKEAMSPAVPLVISAIERIAGLGLKTAIETAGPAAAQRAVDTIAGTAATAAAAQRAGDTIAGTAATAAAAAV